MSPERWQRVKEVYHSALERPEEQRAAFLAEICGDDDELRYEVESLLAHGEAPENLLDRPAWEAAGELLDTHTMDQAPKLVGQRISHYEIVEKLGEGGMGKVYRAVDTRLGRPVAIKVVNAEFTKRFEREAKAISALNHPHICTLYDVGEHEGAPYLVMEYVEGKPLKGPLPVGEALRYAVQIGQALTAAHKAGIVHRDLKPDNILLTSQGSVKVLDFGLAKLQPSVAADAPPLTSMTEQGVVTGTAPYMSPEQAQGEPVDARSDIFSFGTVLYELLSGRRAFRRETTGATLAAVIASEPPPLREAPQEVARIVGKMLAKKRESRYQSAAELLAVLDDELRVLRPRAVLRLLRRPRVSIPLALGLVVLVATGYWYAGRRAKVQWARETALPEIERLIGENDVWRNLTDAYSLAVRAEAYIPQDPKLAALFAKCSVNMSIRTEPEGAKVHAKEYKAPESEWQYLGVSPIDKIRLPIGIFRWKIEKEGYEPVLAASSTWNFDMEKPGVLVPYALTRTLDKKRSIPPEMVRVQSAKTPVGQLPDFYIDKYEVTNRQFRDFINNGGYRSQGFWKHKFIKDGRELPRDQALKDFVDQTGQPGPATWQAGDYPEGQADYPVSGISWYEAAAYAECAGKSLPTQEHWNMAMGGFTPLIQYPQLGGLAVFAPFSNFNGKGAVPVGSLPGITSYGAFDMAGNVREWCWNETPKGRLIRGGAWDDNTYMFENLSQAPPMDRSVKNGFRCALYPDRGKVPSAAFAVLASVGAAVSTEKPVADSIFEVYKEQFSYDKTDLNARVEHRLESPGGWVQEKITFDAAYGGERVIAYLFLPSNTPAPVQTVVYFPGSVSAVVRSSKDIESYYEFSMFLSFLVKSGRAVVYPVYKGTFERGNDATTGLLSGNGTSYQYSELFIKEVKDLKRCIDYLETRRDIDSSKLAYYGMSWGGWVGSIIPAVEGRFKASILVAGSLQGIGRPEVKSLNYITRVKTPTLMLNGKYDTIQGLETTIKPMFDLLGTPAGHKALKLYETDHIPPRNEFIKETLAWLDRYLGPVK